MKNIEFYKKEIDECIELNNTLDCKLHRLRTNEKSCRSFETNLKCNRCLLDSINWLLEEHKETIKLKKWEYDLLALDNFKNEEFKNYIPANDMKNKGYFKGVIDTSMTIAEILEKCEVEEDE